MGPLAGLCRPLAGGGAGHPFPRRAPLSCSCPFMARTPGVSQEKGSGALRICLLHRYSDGTPCFRGRDGGDPLDVACLASSPEQANGTGTRFGHRNNPIVIAHLDPATVLSEIQWTRALALKGSPPRPPQCLPRAQTWGHWKGAGHATDLALQCQAVAPKTHEVRHAESRVRRLIGVSAAMLFLRRQRPCLRCRCPMHRLRVLLVERG